MAEALAALYDKAKIEVSSEGVTPVDKIHPSVKATVERGVNLSRKRSKLLTSSMLRKADDIIVMRARMRS
jgi:protein-tyrosine-phosphatase